MTNDESDIPRVTSAKVAEWRSPQGGGEDGTLDYDTKNETEKKVTETLTRTLCVITQTWPQIIAKKGYVKKHTQAASTHKL